MKKFEEVAGHIRQADGKACFIIGAGASKAAGIPLAGELVDLVARDFAHCLNGLSEDDQKNYGRVMSLLSPAEREQLISPLLDGAQISWGQIALAMMMKQHHVARVLTFNFDLVLEKAASLLGLQLPVYDFGGAPTSDISRIAQRSILHLHGQSHGLVLLNSDEETERHRNALNPILRDTVRNHLTIVAGYSGEADGAFGTIKEEYNSHQRLVWLGYSEDPPQHLRPLLDKDYAEYVGGCDFDLTMIELAGELGIWPPPILKNPTDHLLEELSEVADYPIQADEGFDIFTDAKGRLRTVSGDWETQRPDDASAIAEVTKQKSDPDVVERISKASAVLSDAGREALAWVHIREGNALADEASTLDGDEARAKFAQAGEKFAAALEVKPDTHEALTNWGTALRGEAETLDGDAARAKLAQAGEKYAAALKIKKDDHYALFNWGNALSGEAETLEGDSARAKLAQAGEKYAAALEIKPSKSGALLNWGVALYREAEMLEGDEARAKFAQAGEKYAAALEIKPDDDDVLNNWGNSLFGEARTLEGDAARAKFALAGEKYSAALEIKPDMHDVLNNWGVALAAEARTLDGEAARVKLEEAQEKFARAEAIRGEEE